MFAESKLAAAHRVCTHNMCHMTRTDYIPFSVWFRKSGWQETYDAAPLKVNATEKQRQYNGTRISVFAARHRLFAT